jgi:hypothetical protein
MATDVRCGNVGNGDECVFRWRVFYSDDCLVKQKRVSDNHVCHCKKQRRIQLMRQLGEKLEGKDSN